MKRRDPSHKVWFDNKGYWPDYKNKREVIHHKDRNHSNNEFSNLQLMTTGEHTALHMREDGHSMTGKTVPEHRRRKQSEGQMGHSVSERIRKKIGELNRGKTLTEECRKKISIALTGRTISAETRKKMSAASKRRTASDETRKRQSEAQLARRMNERNSNANDPR